MLKSLNRRLSRADWWVALNVVELNSACVGEGARHEVTAGQQRHNPAQKPEILMRWCIEQAGRLLRYRLPPHRGGAAPGRHVHAYRINKRGGERTIAVRPVPE